MIYLTERITVSSNLCNGKPTIRGKRITVETVLGYLEVGESREAILKNFPNLEDADIDACLNFAIRLVNLDYETKSLAA
jgi:uncharacterized protein (DUF433 family)